MEKVYADKSHCCGCGICSFVCPKHAISMQPDDLGFIYPVIHPEHCIDCRACTAVCAFGKNRHGTASVCYAAATTKETERMHSASGGVFSAIAGAFSKDGLICGAAMEFRKGTSLTRHMLDSGFRKFQSSKYVHSHLWPCLQDVENALRNGEKVLFSGTPCQVDAVKSVFHNYLGKQLFTIDIICHGVPSQQFFNDFLSLYQKTHKTELVQFDFRSKKHGWGLNGTATGAQGEERKVTPQTSSYYRYFLDGEIYRENCYQCPYACLQRVGDLTIGDYWGIEKQDPQLLDTNGGCFSKETGISCLFVNNDNGRYLLEQYGSRLILRPVDLRHVTIANTQLREPARYSRQRDAILNSYRKTGYSGVEAIFKKQMLYRSMKQLLKKAIPKSAWNTLKQFLKH